jgi:2,3-bisphosphoglycerate-independent phosphoglycerate mutase
MTPRPVVLCILDGFGERAPADDNAISLARAPVWQRLRQSFPHATLRTDGEAVGLPVGQMGNSECGHQNIGAGRVVLQDLPRINQAVEDGSLGALVAQGVLVAKTRASGGAVHMLGLLSPGGVHSHQKHLTALAHALADAGLEVRVHAFLDGRDVPPRSAREYVATFLKEIADRPRIRVATIGGRYYGMDRDKRWERVALAYETIAEGKGPRAADALAAIDASYVAGVTDEFVKPVAIGDHAGMRDGDGVLMCNFRADRAREILTALLDPKFDGFARPRRIAFAAACGLVEYAEALNPFMTGLFPPLGLRNTLGETVANAGKTQLRIAETEKYAHVTFFLNGGEEQVFPGEDRILVPSPKVATYDLQPAMSAPEVTEKLVAAIGSGKYDLIVVNYANADMVGHTGILPAAIQAVEALDQCLGKLEAAVKAAGGALLVSADHGNVEMMRDPDSGEPYTAHTTNPVPVLLAHPPRAGLRLDDGQLSDLAPTVLALMGLAQPKEMTGSSLLRDTADARAAE